MTAQAGVQEDLSRINAKIGEAEKRHEDRDVEFLASVLHDDLVFRRADGSIVGKQDYLKAVPTRTYERLESEVVEINERQDSTVVTVIVDAAGTTASGRFEGRFRNTRVFVNDGGRWLCRIWVNVPVQAG
jgi:ketosteroid isomerase-like protein